jgi:hypothetical protein
LVIIIMSIIGHDINDYQNHGTRLRYHAQLRDAIRASICSILLLPDLSEALTRQHLSKAKSPFGPSCRLRPAADMPLQRLGTE